MFISEIDCVEVKHEVSKLIKILGIKHRIKKFDFKNTEKKESFSVFKTRLESLKQKKVKLPQCFSLIEIPAFLIDMCHYIEASMITEGLFRKAGSSARQRELKALLNSGGRLSSELNHHVIDVANVLKVFLRELPEPLIPYRFHEILLKCLILKERKVEAVLLSCLLMPVHHINSLAYLMNFLRRVSLSSEMNKMDTENLAIIMTPNIMPITVRKITHCGSLRVNQHIEILQILIENALLIGVLPECVREKLMLWQPLSSTSSHDELESSHYKKKKKKRRSGSLTRMISGIRKMVGKGSPVDSSVTPEVCERTPCIMSTGKKRKASDISVAAPFSAKKKKEVMKMMPQECVLADTYSHTCLTPRILISTQRKSPLFKSKRNFSTRHLLENFSDTSNNSVSDSHLHISRISHGSKMKVSSDSSADLNETQGTKSCNSSQDSFLSTDYVRIPKSEYEDIKFRVSKIESRLSHELENLVGVSISDCEESPPKATSCANTVQSAYERTLEEYGKLNYSSTDELAKQLSRELKIRRSDNKIIRSPSARKIGSLRRRSKENVPGVGRNLSLNTSDRPRLFRNHHYLSAKSLRRGKPNTVYSGLPQPNSYPLIHEKHSCYNDNEIKLLNSPRKSYVYGRDKITCRTSLESNNGELNLGVLTRSRAQNASSFHMQTKEHDTVNDKDEVCKHEMLESTDLNTNWITAEKYLEDEKIEESRSVVSGRPSVAKIRMQNAGMVLAKAKIFDAVLCKDKDVHCLSHVDIHNSECRNISKTFKTCDIKQVRRTQQTDIKSNSQVNTKSSKLRNNSCRISKKKSLSPGEKLLNKATMSHQPCELSRSSIIEFGKENKFSNTSSFFDTYLSDFPNNIKNNLSNSHTPSSSKKSDSSISPLKDCNRTNIRPVNKRLGKNSDKICISSMKTAPFITTQCQSPRQLHAY